MPVALAVPEGAGEGVKTAEGEARVLGEALTDRLPEGQPEEV